MSVTKVIEDYIRSGETKDKKLGLEIEHFVINDKGIQITFPEITQLIEKVGKDINAELSYTDGYVVGYVTDEYVITLEPSCQFEISIVPYEHLEDIERVYKEFRKTWDGILKREGYHLFVSGNLPAVENGIITPFDIPLSKKKRYKYMDQYFKEVGRFGEYMMRASCSTQISIDYDSEEDMRRKLKVLEIISPLLMIMYENKNNNDFTLPGNEGKKHLLRIQEWDALDSERTGFLEGSLEDDFGYENIANIVLNTPLILLTQNGVTTYVAHKTALDLINDKEYEINEERILEDKSLLEHFISMGFFHFRVKKYIEIRVADSIPIKTALSYMALIKGLIYTDNVNKLEEIFKNVKNIDDINNSIESIEKYGLDAVIYDDKTALEYANLIIDLAYEKLDQKEKEYLLNVRDFWNNSK